LTLVSVQIGCYFMFARRSFGLTPGRSFFFSPRTRSHVMVSQICLASFYLKAALALGMPNTGDPGVCPFLRVLDSVRCFPRSSCPIVRMRPPVRGCSLLRPFAQKVTSSYSPFSSPAHVFGDPTPQILFFFPPLPAQFPPHYRVSFACRWVFFTRRLPHPPPLDLAYLGLVRFLSPRRADPPIQQRLSDSPL